MKMISSKEKILFIVLSMSIIFSIICIHQFNNNSIIALSQEEKENFQNKNNENDELKIPTNISDDNYYHNGQVSINGVKINVDLAITETQKEKGLSIKNNLSEKEGMLFIFDKPDKRGFWMNNMKFPIDIIWLDKDRKIIHIEEKLDPCLSTFLCKVYRPQSDSLYVLETVAGFSEKNKIKVGDEVEIKIETIKN